MNSQQRYRMKYLGWLTETVSDFLNAKVLSDMLYGLLCFLVLILFPISMPTITVMRMVITKRNLRKEYGHNELMSDD